jgi:predicted extracellular nuclease
VQLHTAPAGDATTPVAVDAQGHLTLNPGRIAPADPAFTQTRKSLAVEFKVGTQHLICINNHLSSKHGDSPLWAAMQPPVLHSELERLLQVQVLRSFVAQIQARNPQAAIVLAGDFNDFYASGPLRTLTAAGLHNLIETLPLNERYTYVYNGSSQTLDHLLVSAPVFSQWRPEIDVVHVNAELSEAQGAASDHDPVVARFTLPQ